MNSFAFSYCWVPEFANIFIHWHELRKDGPISYPFDKPPETPKDKLTE